MSWRHVIGVGVIALGLGGCFGSAGTAGKAPNEPLVDSEQEVDGQLGKRVRVVGEAQNAGGGATVVDGGLVVHVEEFRQWPVPIIGKKVEVVGRLERGMAGPRTASSDAHVVLRQASYLLIE